MRDFASQTIIELRDRTDAMSPIGDISWTRNALDSLPAIERETFEGEEYGDPVHTDVAERREGPWFISFRSLVDLDSSSLRVTEIDSFLSSIIIKALEDVTIGSKTTSRFRVTDLAINRKSRQIAEEIASLFSLATHISLEPGFSNAFSEGLEQAIAEHGEAALTEIAQVILGEESKPSIAMEALQYVGHAESGKFLNERRKMLERCLLESGSAWVRDGAGLGIASLNDARSIDSLERAINMESSRALKEDLTLVLDQLQATSSD